MDLPQALEGPSDVRRPVVEAVVAVVTRLLQRVHHQPCLLSILLCACRHLQHEDLVGLEVAHPEVLERLVAHLLLSIDTTGVLPCGPHVLLACRQGSRHNSKL